MVKLKQFVGKIDEFDHFVGLTPKGFKNKRLTTAAATTLFIDNNATSQYFRMHVVIVVDHDKVHSSISYFGWIKFRYIKICQVMIRTEIYPLFVELFKRNK